MAKPKRRQGFVTRTDLCKRWHISRSTIIKKETQGIITPIKGRSDKKEPVYYAMSEVLAAEHVGVHRLERARKNSEGHLVGEVFRLFANGANLVDIVSTMNLKPELVDELYEQYSNSDLESRRQQRLYSQLETDHGTEKE